MVERYGPDLEYDLHHELGLDLLDWFRGARPWGQLIRLAERLPQGGRFWAARAGDDEVAARYVAQHPEDRRKAPTHSPLAEYTRTNQLLTSLVDTVSTLIHRVDMVTMSKPGRPRYLPPVQTALDRAYEGAEVEQLGSLTDEATAAIERAEQAAQTGGAR